jgi:hypothetical protein
MPPYLGFSVSGLLAFHKREVEFFPVKSLGVIKWLLPVGPSSAMSESGGWEWPQRPEVCVVMQQFGKTTARLHARHLLDDTVDTAELFALGPIPAVPTISWRQEMVEAAVRQAKGAR